MKVSLGAAKTEAFKTCCGYFASFLGTFRSEGMKKASFGPNPSWNVVLKVPNSESSTRLSSGDARTAFFVVSTTSSMV